MFDVSPSGAGGLIDTVFADSDASRAAYRRNLRIPAWLIFPIVAVLSAWILCYVSGYFPYFGRYQREQSRAGNLFSNGNPLGTIGLPYAYLFKGQTLFIDYDVEQQGAADLTIYLHHPRVPTLGLGRFTYATIKESGKGRFVYVVPESGFYDITPSVFGSLKAYHIRYLVTWGAVWAGESGIFPATTSQIQPFPIVAVSDSTKRFLPSLPR